jgi:transposase
MEFIGIDVAKAQLEYVCRPSGETGTIANQEEGIRELVARCQALTPTLIVLEATGGYEAALVAALTTAGLPLVVVNPRPVRDFARATGPLAKTDAIDAQVLALFAERGRPAPRPLPDEAAQALEALRTRRRQLVEMLTAERNRLLIARAPVRRDLQQHIRFLERRLREGASRALHGRPRRQQVESGDPRLLPAAARRGQTRQGGPHRLHAEVAHHPQRDRAHRDAVAVSTHTRQDLIFKTVLTTCKSAASSRARVR